MDVLYETFNCIVSLSSSRTIDIVINDDRIDYDMIIRTIHRLIIEKSLINIYFCGETRRLFMKVARAICRPYKIFVHLWF